MTICEQKQLKNREEENRIWKEVHDINCQSKTNSLYPVLIYMNVLGLTQPIDLKPSLFARLVRNYIVKVSLKT